MNVKIKRFGIALMMIGAVLGFFSIAAAAQTAPPLLKFADLQKFDPEKQTFRIEAFVFNIYKCPPCAPGMMCKPCIPDNLTVVDRIDENDTASMKSLRIMTEETAKFTRKEKYLFTVRVKAKPDAGAPVTEVELVDFKKLRSGRK